MTTDDGTARAAWDDLAEGFDEHVTPAMRSLSEEVLDLVGLKGGTRLLDVAAGSGGLAIPAARRGAEVLATDISPAMIEHLDARARDEELTNIEGRVMDAYDLDLDDGAFEVAASMAGVSILPDLERGLAEMVRVTAPGGRAVIVNFGPPDRAEWLEVFMGAMQAALPGFSPATDEPSPAFRLADPRRMREELTDAGLEDVRVEQVDWPMEVSSGTHLLNVIRNANPMAAEMVGGLTDEQAEAVQDALDAALDERAEQSQPAVLTTECNVGIGTK